MDSTAKKNVFVIGLDDFNGQMLKNIRGAEEFEFFQLLKPEDVLQADHFEFEQLLDRAEEQLVKFDRRVDAIIGYYDFPTSDMVPILRKRRNLPAQSIESVVRCEHKYWSRLCQQEVVPENVPEFALVDPRANDPAKNLRLPYPFWLKPVKSFSSYLGFRIDDEADFDRAIVQMRKLQARLAEPFNVLLKHVEMPREVASVDGNFSIAESIISGHQCTLEGFVHERVCYCYGAIDSIRGLKDAPSSFTSYDYPSSLPRRVLDRMADIAARVMERIDYDNACFNIEFFYDESQDRIWLLEVNPRLSKSHAPLFEMVDGSSHQEVSVHLALERRPYLAPHRGPHAHASKFMLRRKEDAVVERIPDESDIEKMREKVPGVRFLPEVKAGQKLSDTWEQDSYTFEYGVLFVGGETKPDILRKREEALALLPFEFRAV